MSDLETIERLERECKALKQADEERSERTCRLLEERERLIARERETNGVMLSMRETLRDEFAKAALIGLLATDRPPTKFAEEPSLCRRREVLAEAAYDYADMMMKARG